VRGGSEMLLAQIARTHQSPADAFAIGNWVTPDVSLAPLPLESITNELMTVSGVIIIIGRCFCQNDKERDTSDWDLRQ
jgi:hypothetical protein